MPDTTPEYDVVSHRPLLARSVRAAGWVATNGLLGIVTQLLAVSVLARLLDAAAFGVVAASLVLINTLDGVSRLGAGSALVQRQHITKSHASSALWLTVALAGCSAAVLWILAPWIEGLFGVEGLAPVTRMLSFVLVVRVVAAVPQALLERQLDQRFIGLLSVGAQLGGFAPVAIAGALEGLGALALVYGYLAEAVIRALGLLVVTRQWFAGAPSLQASSEILSYGLGMSLTDLLSRLAAQSDRVVVAKLLGPAAVGFYAIAGKLTSAASTLVGAILDRVLFPAMSRLQQDRKSLREALLGTSAALWLIAIPIIVAVLVSADDFVLLWLGDGWEGVTAPLRVLCIAAFFRLSYKVCAAIIRARGAVYSLAGVQAAYLVLMVTGVGLGAYGYGLLGAATGVAVAAFLNYVFMMRLLHRLVPIPAGGLLAALRPGLVVGTLTFASMSLAQSVLSQRVDPVFVFAAGPMLAVLATSGLLALSPTVVLGAPGGAIARQLLAALPESVLAPRSRIRVASKIANSTSPSAR